MLRGVAIFWVGSTACVSHLFRHNHRIVRGTFGRDNLFLLRDESLLRRRDPEEWSGLSGTSLADCGGGERNDQDGRRTSFDTECFMGCKSERRSFFFCAFSAAAFLMASLSGFASRGDGEGFGALFGEVALRAPGSLNASVEAERWCCAPIAC